MQPGPVGPPVKNNMAMSIVAILFFWPLAIPAIVQAAKVNPLLQVGNVAGAEAAAAESRKWSKWAFILGVVVWVVTCGFLVVGVLLADSGTGS